MKLLKLLLACCLILFLSSCKEDGKERIVRLVNEWQGKEIVFPPNMTFTIYGKDTVDYKIPNTDYKILVYVDSVGCTSCKLQLPKWKKFIQQLDSLTKGEIPVLFFFHPKDKKEVQYLLRRDNFSLPVCIDSEDRLYKQNRFPSDMTFQTFLLNRENKISILGNPIHNTVVKDLYLKQLIGKDDSNKHLMKTIVETSQKEIDFGVFDKSEIKEGLVILKNIGDNPLVIVDVSTTCGCTAVTYDKQPAKVGESLQVKVKMTPKDTGFFDEVITIKYNSMNNQPVKVELKGKVR